jgi:hypothetical protein
MLPDVHLALEGANGGAWGACEDARRGCADRPARVKFAKCILVVIHLSHCMRQKAPRTLTNRWPRDCRCCDLGGEGSAARSPHEPSIGGSAPRPFSGDAIAASRKSSLACKGPGEDPCDTVSSGLLHFRTCILHKRASQGCLLTCDQRSTRAGAHKSHLAPLCILLWTTPLRIAGAGTSCARCVSARTSV